MEAWTMRRAFGGLALAMMVACGSEAGSPTPDTEVDSPAKAPAPPQKVANPDMPSPPPASAALGAPYPVVFMHGMGGFGKLELGPVAITYFDGVVEELTTRGEQVFVTLVPPYDTSEQRAKALAKQLDVILARTGKAKVNLVGHSQGGLDARVLASPAGLGYGDRIASVTTVATPHRGSKVADLSLGLLSAVPKSIVDSVTEDFLRLVQKTAYELQSDAHLRAQVVELSEKHMAEVFNPKYVDDSRVQYASYAGRTNLRMGLGVCDDGKFANEPSKVDPAQLLVAGTALYLEQGKLEVNDGLVTVASAKWGAFLQCVPADHLKEVGQLGPSASSFDHVAFYRTLVERIRAGGF
jgi:triacylglycerol lipase